MISKTIYVLRKGSVAKPGALLYCHTQTHADGNGSTPLPQEMGHQNRGCDHRRDTEEILNNELMNTATEDGG